MSLFHLLAYIIIATKQPVIETDPITPITNSFRQAYGCKKVTENTDLMRAAQARADQLYTTGNFSHEGCWETIKPIYKYVAAGENLAEGFFVNEKAVVAWMKSPKHRENIVNCQYREIGIGRRGPYIVQLFGRRW